MGMPINLNNERQLFPNEPERHVFRLPSLEIWSIGISCGGCGAIAILAGLIDTIIAVTFAVVVMMEPTNTQHLPAEMRLKMLI